jgi:hypothetical protein
MTAHFHIPRKLKQIKFFQQVLFNNFSHRKMLVFNIYIYNIYLGLV